MNDYIQCPGCSKQLKETTSGKYRKHLALGKGENCDYSGTVIPKEDACSPTDNAKSEAVPSARSSKGGVTGPASPATPSTDSSPPSQEPADDASTASARPALPGVEQYVTRLSEIQAEQAAEYRALVDQGLTFSPPAPYVVEPEQDALFSQPGAVEVGTVPSNSSASPSPAFSQPAGRKSEAPPLPMSAEAGELAARVKELFYAYDNRRSADNRSAQVTMGPSEMGTPCDRRLALSLMRMPPVNPGGDGWAAFVGTCIHAGLEQMFMWADAGTGRFAVEQRLEFDSKYVPKGTADLIDRTLFMLDDHKCQGRWSRNKLRTQGPSWTYRTQAHVYAYGARKRGEKIERVAIISWPRDEATLDDLYVWTEEYRPDIVQKAFARVDRIGGEVEDIVAGLEAVDGNDIEGKALAAANFDVADDCRFCPFYMPNARDITRGCNGKK